QLGAHLAGEEDGGHGVHDGVRDGGDQVRGAGTARGEGDTDPAGGLRVALRGVPRTLLVAAEDVPDARVVERVVRREVRATRNSEYQVDALVLEAFHDGVDCSHRRDLLLSG